MNTVFTSFLLVAVLVELLIGIRLIQLSRRTRGLPETLWGWAWVLDSVSQATAPFADQTAGPLWVDVVALVSVGLGSASLSLLALSIWFVFRPDRRGLRHFVIALSAILLVSFAAFELLGSVTFPDGEGRSVMRWINRLVAIGLLAWGAVESLQARFASEKQRRLGLADRLEVLRFQLWATSATCLLAFLLLLVGRDLIGIPNVAVRSAQPFLVLAAVICMWLTFFPTGWMRRQFGGGDGG